MKDKIKVNLNEEKVLRLSVEMDEGVAVVNNPTQAFRQEIVNKIVVCLTKNEDFDEKQMMMDLINHCTNVEFEGDIFEAVYLSHEVQMITNEVLIIFQELVSEAYQLIQLALQQVKNERLQSEILDERKEIDKVEVKEEVEVPQKAIKKPQRSRRVVRK